MRSDLTKGLANSIKALLAQGNTVESIIKVLVEEGWSRSEAISFINKVKAGKL